MLKRILAAALALLLLLSVGGTALAAGKDTGYSVKTTDGTKAGQVTVGVYADAALKNGKLEISYPAALTLLSARAALPKGVTDIDTSKSGKISFAWAAYAAQKDVLLLELTFRGQANQSYELTLATPENGASEKAELTIAYRFLDVVDSNAWYYDAVYAAYEAGLMNGVGEDLFAPSKPLNRAMLVTVLYRMAGSPKISGKSAYSDVAAGMWYTDAVIWATKQKVVNGYPDGTFAPGAPLTRQEMAAMLYRFYQSQGGKDNGSAKALDGFADKGEVSDWALEAMRWCVTKKIISGFNPTSLRPAEGATRAQVAMVLVNYKNIE